MSTVVFKKKSRKAPTTTTITTTNLSRKRASRDEDASNSESEDDVVLAKSKNGVRGIDISAKRPRQAAEEIDVTYSGDRSATNRNINDATRAIANIDGYDEAALLGRPSNSQKDLDKVDALRDVSKSAAQANINRKAQAGPIKAPTNIRAISVVDYQPDVCKDYKQTGFCGFGDTCKFLHDRGDFKQGWQLDRDWEDVGKGKKTATKEEDKDAEEFSKIPFKCVICKGDYKNPVITKCGHYFCEKCAIDRYKKTPACAQCNNGTGGLFSGAKKLKALLDEKQRRIDTKEQEAIVAA